MDGILATMEFSGYWYWLVAECCLFSCSCCDLMAAEAAQSVPLFRDGVREATEDVEQAKDVVKTSFVWREQRERCGLVTGLLKEPF